MSAPRLVGALAALAAAGGGAVLAGDLADRGADPPPTQRARIVRAVDGDTIAVRLGGAERSVRLVGIDAPESAHPSEPDECGGPEAAAALRAIAREGAAVRLVVDPSQARRDRYGRLLRYAELGGRDLGLAQLRGGHAEAYVHGGEAFRRLRGYRRAEERARGSAVGIWGSCGSAAGGSP